MIYIGSYYRVNTRYGWRTIKCMEFDSSGNPYGIYSPSDCQSKGDNEGMVVPDGSLLADQPEINAWDTWFN